MMGAALTSTGAYASPDAADKRVHRFHGIRAPRLVACTG